MRTFQAQEIENKLDDFRQKQYSVEAIDKIVWGWIKEGHLNLKAFRFYMDNQRGN